MYLSPNEIVSAWETLFQAHSSFKGEEAGLFGPGWVPFGITRCFREYSENPYICMNCNKVKLASQDRGIGFRTLFSMITFVERDEIRFFDPNEAMLFSEWLSHILSNVLLNSIP